MIWNFEQRDFSLPIFMLSTFLSYPITAADLVFQFYKCRAEDTFVREHLGILLFLSGQQLKSGASQILFVVNSGHPK